ncbi:hypothetical protein, partial [Cupriavidus sp. YAF13]|uniref:hypothetical protein n=1 Tax=Cupriavidus sp. YAF13 TaxID=3233075 RepID=UPI003F936C46
MGFYAVTAAVAFAPEVPYDVAVRGWLLFLWAAMVFAPKGHTTSPCGGCRSLFFDRQRKLTKRKPPCREQSNQQSNQAVWASVVA